MFEYKEKYNIAIVGATGIVGEALLNILKSRDFPINEISADAPSKTSLENTYVQTCTSSSESLPERPP